MAQKGELPTLDLFTQLQAAVSIGDLSAVQGLAKHSQAAAVTAKPPKRARVVQGPRAFLTVLAASGGHTEVLACLLNLLRDQEDVSRTHQYRPSVDAALVNGAATSLSLPTLRLVVEDYGAALAPAGTRVRRDPTQPSPLYAAVHAETFQHTPDARSLDMVQYLLGAGAEVDVPLGTKGMTALCVAAGAGWVEGVKMLLEAGAAPNPPRPKWKHPLFEACRAPSGAVATIKLLLGAGADVNWASSRGRTPLFAISHQSGCVVDVARTLLLAGADARHRVNGQPCFSRWGGEMRKLLTEWHNNGRWLLYRGAAVQWRVRKRGEARAARQAASSGAAAQ